jgi:hypothetical protein
VCEKIYALIYDGKLHRKTLRSREKKKMACFAFLMGQGYKGSKREK